MRIGAKRALGGLQGACGARPVRCAASSAAHKVPPSGSKSSAVAATAFADPVDALFDTLKRHKHQRKRVLDVLDSVERNGMRVSPPRLTMLMHAAAAHGEWQRAVGLLEGEFLLPPATAGTLERGADGKGVSGAPGASSGNVAAPAVSNVPATKAPLLNRIHVNSALNACARARTNRAAAADRAIALLGAIKAQRKTQCEEEERRWREGSVPAWLAKLRGESKTARAANEAKRKERKEKYGPATAASRAPRSNNDLNGYRMALQACHRAGRPRHWRHVIALVEEMRSDASGPSVFPSRRCYTKAIAAALKLDDKPLARRYFELLCTVPSTAGAHDKAGHDGGSAAGRNHGAAALSAEDLVATMSAAATLGEWDAALGILHEMHVTRGVGTPSVVAYNIALYACKVGHQLERALELLEDMEMRSSRDHKGVSAPAPDLVSYNTVLSVCSTCRRSEEAVEVFHNLSERSGLEPDIFTFNTLISVFQKCGEWDRAVQMLEIMRDGAGIEAGTASGVEDTVAAVARLEAAVAGMAAEEGHSEGDGTVGGEPRAQHTADELAEMLRAATRDAPSLRQRDTEQGEGVGGDGHSAVRPDVITYNAVISACGQAGELETAVDLFQQMQIADGIVPSVLTVNTMMHGLNRVGHWPQALALFEQLNRPRAAAAAAAAAAEAGVDGTVGVLGQPSGGGAALAELALENQTCWLPDGLRLTPTRQSFHAALRACEAGGRVDIAFDLLADMRAAAGSSNEGVTMRAATTQSGNPQLLPNGTTYWLLFRVLREGHELEKAVSVADELLRQHGHVLDARLTANAAALGDDGGSAVTTVAVAEDTTLHVPSLLEQLGNMCLNPVLALCMDEGEHDTVMRLFNQQRRFGFRPSEAGWFTVLRVCTLRQDYAAALQLFEEFREAYDRVSPSRHCRPHPHFHRRRCCCCSLPLAARCAHHTPLLPLPRSLVPSLSFRSRYASCVKQWRRSWRATSTRLRCSSSWPSSSAGPRPRRILKWERRRRCSLPTRRTRARFSARRGLRRA